MESEQQRNLEEQQQQQLQQQLDDIPYETVPSSSLSSSTIQKVHSFHSLPSIRMDTPLSGRRSSTRTPDSLDKYKHVALGYYRDNNSEVCNKAGNTESVSTVQMQSLERITVSTLSIHDFVIDEVSEEDVEEAEEELDSDKCGTPRSDISISACETNVDVGCRLSELDAYLSRDVTEGAQELIERRIAQYKKNWLLPTVPPNLVPNPAPSPVNRRKSSADLRSQDAFRMKPDPSCTNLQGQRRTSLTSLMGEKGDPLALALDGEVSPRRRDILRHRLRKTRSKLHNSFNNYERTDNNTMRRVRMRSRIKKVASMLVDEMRLAKKDLHLAKEMRREHRN